MPSLLPASQKKSSGTPAFKAVMRGLRVCVVAVFIVSVVGCVSTKFSPSQTDSSHTTPPQLVGGGYAFSFLAPDDGTVYVYETGDHQKNAPPIMSYTVRRGDKVAFTQAQLRERISSGDLEQISTEVWFYR